MNTTPQLTTTYQNRASRRAIVALRIALFAAAPIGTAVPAKACFDDAAVRYGVPSSLLIAIATVESGGNARAINVNPGSGTVDAGLMQINSQHLRELARHGIAERELFEPCTSIHVGAWILARAVQQFGATWEAVGAYNAGYRPDRRAQRARYADRVRRVYLNLEASR